MRLLLPLLLLSTPLAASIVGRVVSPESLSATRIDRSPVADKAVWLAYLRRSEDAMRADKAALAAERRAGQPVPLPPREAKGGATGLALDRVPAWYASAEAKAIADTVVSFQTPAGGWGKNLDRTAPPRAPGQSWTGGDAKAGAHATQDGAGGWSFVGTLDNDATIAELRFLARVHANAPDPRYRAAFLKGVAYLLQAQYPNGGWPQVYPLQGGYHDALTLNDDTMIHAVALLRDVAAGGGDFAFVPPETRGAAAAAVELATRTLLAAQVVTGGKRTIWAQQYDPLTLQPVAARAFEPVALATGESAAVLRFLMAQPNPSPAMRAAIEAGVAWFRDHAVRNGEWTRTPGGRRLVAKPGAAPLWARFYDPQTGKPVFGDRDGAVHDDVNAISRERRDGYSWFNTSGASLLAAYDTWRRRQG
jgi:PelA/Pel-15E family pectate lyase